MQKNNFSSRLRRRRKRLLPLASRIKKLKRAPVKMIILQQLTRKLKK